MKKVKKHVKPARDIDIYDWKIDPTIDFEAEAKRIEKQLRDSKIKDMKLEPIDPKLVDELLKRELPSLEDVRDMTLEPIDFDAELRKINAEVAKYERFLAEQESEKS